MSTMIDLDDAGVFKRFDPGGMLKCLGEMSGQCQQAWAMAMNFDLPEDYREVDKVVFSGMGSSSVGAELVASLAAPEAKLPISIYRGYDLPAFVDGKTLVIACSYSGMTEETLSAFRQALRTEAKKLVITTGGKLKTLAEESNIPVFSFDYKSQPRAALGFNFIASLGLLQKLGFIADKSADVRETIQVLEGLSRKLDKGVALPHNRAKQLAQRLDSRLAVMYGGGILAGVARRWKTQLNENGKAWAFYEVSPDLNHNAVAGYQFPRELTDKMLVILLRSASLPRVMQLSYEAIAELMEQAKVDYQFVDGEGTSQLCQMMSLILFGDYTSCYLAILHQADPTPVSAIDYLKSKLARSEK